MRRVCKCGCGEPIDAGGNGRREYVDSRHKDRAYRKRVAKLAKTQGLAVRANLTILRTTTSKRLSDAQIKRNRSKRSVDMRVTYSRVLEQLTTDYQHHWHMKPAPARARARSILQDCLTPKQLAHLKRAA